MKAMVVDDEAPARRRLTRMLERIPEVEITCEAASAAEAIEGIARTSPDVVFLDIQLHGMDGLTVAERCCGIPMIVFVTAHAEHAVRAFELDTVDYLLKPVRFERLEASVCRALSRLREHEATPARDEYPRVVAFERGTTVITDAAAVTRFAASEKYVAFQGGGRELLTEESLASLEERLARFGFVRVHRAELVRVSAIAALVSHEGGHSVRLADGQIAPVSRRMVAQLRQRLGH